MQPEETPVVTSEEPVVPTGDTPSETPAEPTVEQPTEPELFETPDGRKVDAATLQKEWKDNFLPDYTRKSQELAEYKKTVPPQQKEQQPAWKDPNYVPQTYAELIEIAENRALERIAEERQKEESTQRELATMVDNQLAEIRKIDPNLNENQLFMHANKYGFRDLTKAHENLKALEDAKITTEQRTIKNIQSRKENPVAGTPGTAPQGGAPVYGDHHKYGSALEFMQSNQQ